MAAHRRPDAKHRTRAAGAGQHERPCRERDHDIVGDREMGANGLLQLAPPLHAGPDLMRRV
jgi:hypothetical protein